MSVVAPQDDRANSATRVIAHVRRSFDERHHLHYTSLDRACHHYVTPARNDDEQDEQEVMSTKTRGELAPTPPPPVKDHGGGGCRSIDRFPDSHFLESGCQWAERSWLSQEPGGGRVG